MLNTLEAVGPVWTVRTPLINTDIAVVFLLAALSTLLQTGRAHSIYKMLIPATVYQARFVLRARAALSLPTLATNIRGKILLSILVNAKLKYEPGIIPCLFKDLWGGKVILSAKEVRVVRSIEHDLLEYYLPDIRSINRQYQCRRFALFIPLQTCGDVLPYFLLAAPTLN
jgi:hypothetical protein